MATSMDLLTQIDQLEKNAKSLAAGQASRQKGVLESQKRCAEIEEQMQETMRIRDVSTRELKMKVLRQTLREVRESALAEAQSLGSAVDGFNQIAASIDSRFESLQKPTEEDLQVERNAEARLAKANADLKTAEAKWFGKAKAIAEANAEIDKAKQGIKDAKREVLRIVSERVQKATIEQSMQQMNYMMELIVTAVSEQKGALEADKLVVMPKKTKAVEQVTKAADAMSKAAGELAELNAELEKAEERLKNLDETMPEHGEQLKIAAELNTKRDQKKAEHNELFAYHQSVKQEADELQLYERSLINQISDLQVVIRKMKTERAKREVTYRALLTMMKGANVMEVANGADELVSAFDVKGATIAAGIGVGMKKIVKDAFNRKIDTIQKIKAIDEGAAEALEKEEKEIAKAKEAAKKGYRELLEEPEEESTKAEPSKGDDDDFLK